MGEGHRDAKGRKGSIKEGRKKEKKGQKEKVKVI